MFLKFKLTFNKRWTKIRRFQRIFVGTRSCPLLPIVVSVDEDPAQLYSERGVDELNVAFHSSWIIE